MTRSEYKTIIAPKTTITKIEKYGEERSLPSASQALADMVSQMEKNDTLLTLLSELLKKIKQDLKQLKGKTNTRSKKAIEELIELITKLLQTISKDVVANQ